MRKNQFSRIIKDKSYENRIPSRSDKYQSNLLEICVKDDVLQYKGEKNPLFQDTAKDERYLDIREELFARLIKLLEDNFSERDTIILKSQLDNVSQCEAAKLLNVNQSSITKKLYGDPKFPNNKEGIIGRLRTMAMANQEILDLLEEIKQIMEDQD